MAVTISKLRHVVFLNQHRAHSHYLYSELFVRAFWSVFLQVFQRPRDPWGHGWWRWQMITDWPISIMVGSVRDMNGISLRSVPLRCSLGDYAALASFLGNDLVVGLELPFIREKEILLDTLLAWRS